jgi:hypothetical protein
MADHGRPTLYNSQMQEAADEYVDGFGFDDDGAVKRVGSMKEAVPTVAGLAYRLKVAERTLYNWGKEHESFLQTLSNLQAKQHMMLASGGLTRVYDSAITRLMLANHGYSEKQQVEHSGDLPTIKIKVVNADD